MEKIVLKLGYLKNRKEFYETDEIKINNISFKLKCLIFISQNKMHTRIKYLKYEKYEDNKIAKTSMYEEILPQVIPIIQKVEFCLKKEIENYGKKLESNKKFFSDVPLVFYPPEIEINLNEEYYYIPKIASSNLTNTEIQNLFSNEENILNLEISVQMNRIKNFINLWEKGIENNQKEEYFHNILFQNQHLYPFLFGIINLLNIKKELRIKTENMKENRFDISNGEFIIELKRPFTKLFNEGKSRNNIKKLSSDLISAITQLNLYVFQNDLQNFTEKFQFTKGILLIGNISMNLTKEEKVSLELLKKKYFVNRYLHFWWNFREGKKNKRILR